MSLIDWLLRCPAAWSSHRQPLLAFAQPSTEEEGQTAHLSAHACRDHRILACIVSMWDARFGSHSSGMPAHVAFYVPHLLTISILLFCLPILLYTHLYTSSVLRSFSSIYICLLFCRIVLHWTPYESYANE